MSNRRYAAVVGLLVLALGAVAARADDDRDLVRLDSQMQALQDETGRMQHSFDRRMDEVKNQLARNAEASTKLTAAIAHLQAELEKQAVKSRTDVDEISGMAETLNDGLDQAQQRLTKATARLDAIHPVRLAAPSIGISTDDAYDRALNDYKRGKRTAAWKEFYAYATTHPGTDLAGASYFYMAEIRYDEANYSQAIGYYNLALTMAPSGSKAAAARLKKGAAFVHLGLPDDGIREFLQVIKQYPGSPEATKAKKTIAVLQALYQ